MPPPRGRKRAAAVAATTRLKEQSQCETTPSEPSKTKQGKLSSIATAEREVTEEDVDIKPDVGELQQGLMQQPPLQQQQSQALQLHAMPTILPGAAPHLLVISSSAIASLVNNMDVVSSAVGVSGNASGGGGGSTGPAAAVTAVSAAHKAPNGGTIITKTTHRGRPRSDGAQISTSNVALAASLTATVPPAEVCQLSDYGFVLDEIDLQESDTDEEGYSDIDLEDDELVEDDDEIDLLDPMWTDQATAPRMVFKFETPNIELGLEGRPKSVNPVMYFDKILGNRTNFFNLLAESCNARAKLVFSSNSVAQAYLRNITSKEMEIFIGLCLEMSSTKLPTLADYWHERNHCGFKGFGAQMSLKRFVMILRVFNFDNGISVSKVTRVRSECDIKLDNLRPFIDFFNRSMEDIYKCGQRLVMNDPIVFWKGRLHWNKDLSDKFRCNAVKLHFLTEQTGLLLKIVPDIEFKDRKQNVRNSKLLVTQRVTIAKELLREKLGSGHTVLVSKYYGSYGLGYELSNHETYCTGFLDCKRYGNCKDLILKALAKNSFNTKYASSIMMGKWRRREKCVYFYSSDCIAIYANEGRSNDPRPKLIRELDWQLKTPPYIREHMLNYQVALDRKEMKWDMQLIIYILNLITFNAYIFYTMYAQFGRARVIELHLKDTSKLISYSEFRQVIIQSLLKKVLEEPRSTDTSKPADSEDDDTDKDGPQSHATATQTKLLEVDHIPMMIQRRNGKTMKKKCRICRKGGMLTFSKLCCEACPGMPGLCETPCFKIWHDQLKKSLEAGEQIKTRSFGTNEEQTIYF